MAFKRKSKGLALELALSRRFHRTGTPLVLSELLLRERNCGQVDLARLLPNGTLEFCEVKSGIPDLSYRQNARLRRSAHLCSLLFDRPAKISLASPRNLSNIFGPSNLN